MVSNKKKAENRPQFLLNYSDAKEPITQGIKSKGIFSEIYYLPKQIYTIHELGFSRIERLGIVAQE